MPIPVPPGQDDEVVCCSGGCSFSFPFSSSCCCSWLELQEVMATHLPPCPRLFLLPPAPPQQSLLWAPEAWSGITKAVLHQGRPPERFLHKHCTWQMSSQQISRFKLKFQLKLRAACSGLTGWKALRGFQVSGRSVSTAGEIAFTPCVSQGSSGGRHQANYLNSKN